jgi:hypothetical protein
MEQKRLLMAVSSGCSIDYCNMKAELNRILMCQSGAISVSFTIGSSGAAGLMSLALHFKALRDAQRGQIVD